MVFAVVVQSKAVRWSCVIGAGVVGTLSHLQQGCCRTVALLRKQDKDRVRQVSCLPLQQDLRWLILETKEAKITGLGRNHQVTESFCQSDGNLEVFKKLS